jgi:23S rRNA (adenine2030-N6)-methyltransferase
LIAAHRKWPTGVYALWYPIKNLRETAAFARSIAASGISRVLRAELTLARADNERLGGSGLIVVNPPWRLEDELSLLLPALAQALAAAPAGATRLDWLAREK